MRITYDNGESRTVEVENFYKEVATLLAEENLDNGPVEVVVSLETGESATYEVRHRSGTVFICEMDNDLPRSLLENDIKPVFLTCVDPERNAYKFYKLEPVGNQVKASYGRMGVEKGRLFGERSYMYPDTMYWIKYMEKIRKGYVDRTDVYLTEKPAVKEAETVSESKPRKETASSKLFTKLKAFAKRAVEAAKVKVPITPAIIDESKRLLEKMRQASSVDEFNKELLNLIATLQRPVRTGSGSGVKELMAESQKDFRYILEREDDLIQAMEGTLTGKKPVKTGDFSDFGVEVYDATSKQKEQVLSRLSDSLKPKVKHIYRVIPQQQQKKFNSYIEKHHIHNIKQLWHGSRNQNWASIIANSLKLNPDAIITGKMFGDGIYFAPSSMKSWGYTSYHGTRWAGGRSNTAYMGLYAIAYGKPLDVNRWSEYSNYSKSLIDSKGCNSLHAHAGQDLRNDEIVLYDEAAIVLNYIVEFEG